MDCAKLEPLTFSIGDTLRFNRYFSNYLPSAGWQLQYEIRGGAGKNLAPPAPVAFVSAPDATNTIHEITVTAATTKLWAAGEYILAGYAVNAGSAKRDEIYENAIVLTPNWNTTVDNVPVQTYAQEMICLIQKALANLYASSLLETDVQQTRIVRERRKGLRDELTFWMTFRQNEIAQDNVNNGRPSGRKISPYMNVVSPGLVRGPFGTWPFPQ